MNQLAQRLTGLLAVLLVVVSSVSMVRISRLDLLPLHMRRNYSVEQILSVLLLIVIDLIC